MPTSQDPKVPETAEEWQKLGSLLPSQPSSTGSVLTGRGSTYWTDEELERARLGDIRWHVRNGWTFEGGWLSKGNVKKRPSQRCPTPQPWEPSYNPREHSVAVRMGGEYISAGRYRLRHNGLIVDENGSLTGNHAGCCPGCGTTRDAKGKILGGDYRWLVRAENPNPFAPRHAQVWTYCRVCVSESELMAFRAFHGANAEAIAAKQAPRKQQPEKAGRRLV